MGPLVFVVICEAAADFRTASGLVERVICDQVDWIEAENIQYALRWWGQDPASPFWSWSKIDDAARNAGVRVRGHFDGEVGSPDASITRRALNYLRILWQDGHPIDGILLIRDDDGDQSRRVGLEQGRRSVPDLVNRIVIGLAHLKRECWVLTGYEPQNAREVALLDDLRQELTFDPCLSPERLRAQHDTRSAKRVLDRLTQDDWSRQEACWMQTSLTTLRQRGSATGLTAFLDEVADRLLPLLGGALP